MATLPETNEGTKKISNWDKPGGKLGMVVAALAAAFVLWKILPYLLALTWGLVELVTAGVILFVLIFLITDKSIRRVLSTSYFMLMRAITGFFVDIDPVAIVERRLMQMKKTMATMKEKMGILNGYNMKTKSLIATKQNSLETEVMRVKTYRERGMQQEATVSNNQAVRLDEQVKAAKKRLEDGEKMFKILSELVRHGELSVLDTENEIQVQKENYETAKQQYKVFSSVMSILNGDPDEMAQYQMAMEKMANEVNAKNGEMNYVLNQTGGLLAQFSVDNGVADKKATALLERYDKYGIEGMFDNFGPKPVEEPGIIEVEPTKTSSDGQKTKYF